MSVPFPGAGNLCNDTAVGPDGSVYVTNSLKPQILRLKPGASQFDVFVESATFEQPKEGAGLDGIAFGGDGNLYVNNFTSGGFFRVDVKEGTAGRVTKLTPSRAADRIPMACGRRAAKGSSWPKAAAQSTA